MTIRSISLVFELDPVPEKGQLTDSFGPDAIKLVRSLNGLRWNELPNRIIKKMNDALHFMSPVAYRYYLPAFLVYSCRYPDSLICEAVLHRLSRTGGNSYELARIDIFSNKEREVIFQFIYLMESLDDEGYYADEILTAKVAWGTNNARTD